MTHNRLLMRLTLTLLVNPVFAHPYPCAGDAPFENLTSQEKGILVGAAAAFTLAGVGVGYWLSQRQKYNKAVAQEVLEKHSNEFCKNIWVAGYASGLQENTCQWFWQEFPAIKRATESGFDEILRVHWEKAEKSEENLRAYEGRAGLILLHEQGKQLGLDLLHRLLGRAVESGDLRKGDFAFRYLQQHNSFYPLQTWAEVAQKGQAFLGRQPMPQTNDAAVG